MPVWHERLEPWRDGDELAVVGITQEQHPDRCRLFSQWKGLDWPILWDPFNLTGSKVVPLHVLVDEHGIVRAVNPKDEELEDFLLTDFPAPADLPAVQAGAERLPGVGLHPAGSFEALHLNALSDLLWRVDGRFEGALRVLEAQAAERPEEPRLAFRAGVARRLRYDSDAARPEDFQVAVDHWSKALAGDPNQYIWRRRIQQYGPRMDKPYPFYDWVAEAQRDVAARGEEPVSLRAELTPVELAQRGGFRAQDTTAEPDPERALNRDGDGWIAIETAVAFDTGKTSRVASVHLALRPRAGAAHWNNEAGPTQVWVEPGEGLEAARLERSLLEPKTVPDAVVSDEVRRLTVELELAEGSPGGTLRGYALYYVCEDAEGTCLYLRQDFEVEVRRPAY